MANNENKSKGALIPVIIGVGLTILLLTGFGLLIKFDIAGFGNVVMRPLLDDVPVLNMILPNEEITEDSPEDIEGNIYNIETLEEAIHLLSEKDSLLENKDEEIRLLYQDIDRLQDEVDRLRNFEETYEAFLREREEFDELVVFGDDAPSVEEYQRFYESIYPQNAENIYERIMEEQYYDERASAYAKTYQDMRAADAARILESMMTDLDLVVLILENINSEQRARILGAMEPRTAARITRRMAPQ
ncbi:hypothetical protein EDC19_0294 [Natranaerovirga hydrolytica]|uniref:Flagellar motility protein MotE (MotC chaperone) n=1 Tax=Natranaerovirga hydrolytica TaxID=680378 RepID=A0A4R1MZA7_9FIRM|nr:hypothetical protein [Natranaerovirga hydrolytica]TCK97892.1 hypothetical protein EDC19_0294 [Natranaerovirga hydrolytica]